MGQNTSAPPTICSLTEPSYYRDKELLEKYELKSNDAILAEEKHMFLYDDITTKYHPKYLAGGAAQNAARGAQVRFTLIQSTIELGF